MSIFDTIDFNKLTPKDVKRPWWVYLLIVIITLIIIAIY